MKSMRCDQQAIVENELKSCVLSAKKTEPHWKTINNSFLGDIQANPKELASGEKNLGRPRQGSLENLRLCLSAQHRLSILALLEELRIPCLQERPVHCSLDIEPRGQGSAKPEFVAR